MLRKLFITSVATLVAGSVNAQELTYGGLLASYGDYSSGGTDLNLTVFSGELATRFEDFDVWVNATTVEVDVSGLPVNLSADIGQLGFGYTFADNFRADLSAASASVALGPNSIDLDLKELGLAYDTGSYFGRLSYSEVENQAAIPVDSIVGLHVGYEGAEGVRASVSGHWVDDTTNTIDSPIVILTLGYEADNWNVNLDAAKVEIANTDLRTLSLSGGYDFNDKWSMYGTVTDLEAGPLDANVYRVGGAYRFTQRAKVFADVAKLDSNVLPDDATGVTVGVSMDLGDKPASYETTIDRLSGIVENELGYEF